MVRPPTTFRDLWKALKSHNIHDECTIYLDLLFGLHPHGQRLASYIKFCIPFCTLTFVFILCLLLTVAEFKGVESLGESDLLSPMYQVVFTFLAYRTRQKTLSKLMKKLDGFWTYDRYNEEFQAQLKVTDGYFQTFFLLYRIGIIGVILLYTVTPFFMGHRTLIVKWYDLCDLELPLCYGICMGIQTYIMTLVIFLLTCDGLYMSFIVKAFCQLKMVKYNFESLKFNENITGDDEKTIREVAVYVEHHSIVMDFVGDLKGFYSPLLLSQLASCTYTLCIGSFLLTIDGIPPPAPRLGKFIFYIVCILGQIGVYCVSGQILMDQCYSVADVVYETKWWCKTQPRLRKMLTLVILRAQRVGSLSVGGIATVDMKVFGYVAKTAFSFYTLMNQFYEKKKNAM